jgi:hypothetical protein
MVTAMLWVRSYFATERLALSRFNDEGNLTYWRWDEVQVGKGGIGFHRLVQWRKRPGFREAIFRMIASPGNKPSLIFHLTKSAGYPNFHVLSAGFGAFVVLLLAALPATVRLSRTHLHYKSIRGGLYSWSDFSGIQCAQWHGLLRITLEMSAGAVVVIAAPVKRAADIELILEAIGKLVPQKPEPSR